MIKSFFDPKYPMRDGRRSIPQDESTAVIAYKIIRGEDELIWHARRQGLVVPTPNKSARIEARHRVGADGSCWVDVRASAEFFAACEKLSIALANPEGMLALLEKRSP